MGPQRFVTRLAGSAMTLLLLCLAAGLSAQDAHVTMGSWHLNSANVEASRQMFVVMGGKASRMGHSEIVEFPGVTVFLQNDEAPANPSGGTVGSVVDHVGFTVPDIQEAITSWSARGVPIELSDRRDDQAWIMTPDQLRIEILEMSDQERPIQHHHVHYSIPANAVPGAQAWYAQAFGAWNTTRGNFQSSDVPGANLTWGVSRDGVKAGSGGRVFDHVGFVADDIDALCAHWEAEGIVLDQPCERDPATGRTRAYLTDPWGTRIVVMGR